ncbi:MAG TPA: type I-F CRISPR-associated endoribonuclease Cas6/Csy4 [Candidatus Competibacteraceae bacterium]|nr:type I-F CRISPR-associated endoribonuclease Cas6/Csy4 [Candidatus Competibacteraceae bacterium]
MKPAIYVDLEMLAGGSGGEPMPAPVLAGAALNVLHGAFRQWPGRYALALPGVSPDQANAPGRMLRVFAGSRDDLDALVAATGGHPVIRDYTRIGYPRPVPGAFSGPWIEYRRYRIPSRKSLRKPDDTLRERRMQAARERGLPFFQIRSRSNGQPFMLYVQALEVTAGGAGCQPDSYGLSVSSRPFAVPRL